MIVYSVVYVGGFSVLYELWVSLWTFRLSMKPMPYMKSGLHETHVIALPYKARVPSLSCRITYARWTLDSFTTCLQESFRPAGEMGKLYYRITGGELSGPVTAVVVLPSVILHVG